MNLKLPFYQAVMLPNRTLVDLVSPLYKAKSVVVVITDGRPLSYGRTARAARSVRKAARLVWVPVTRSAPLRQVKRWATRRWQENVVVVRDFKELETPDTVNHVVANICPSHSGDHLHHTMWR